MGCTLSNHTACIDEWTLTEGCAAVIGIHLPCVENLGKRILFVLQFLFD